MKQIDFSRLSHQELEQLGKGLLNRAKKLDLTPLTDVKDSNPPDLWQKNPIDGGGVDVIVEIKGTKRINASETTKLNSSINNWVIGYRPYSFYLLVFSELNNTARSLLEINLQKNTSRLNFEIFDIKWVNQQRSKFPELFEKWEGDDIENNDYLNKSIQTNKEDHISFGGTTESHEVISNSDISNEFINNSIKQFKNIKSKIFVGGHSWTEENKLDQFISENRWENGRKIRNVTAVNSSEIGDIVLMKSTYSDKGTSFLRIKAIGVVVENKDDGHNLNIDWILLDEYVNVPDLGHLRNTYQLLREKHYQILFKTLLEYDGEIIDEIEIRIKNIKANKFSKSPKKENKKFWWFRNNDVDWTFNNLALNSVHEYVLINNRVETTHQEANFLNINKGDLLLAFQKHKENSVLLILEAENEIDQTNNKIFKYKIRQKLDSPISFDSIIKLNSIANTVITNDLKSNLFPLSAIQYNDIIDIENSEKTNSTEIINDKSKSTTIKNDDIIEEEVLEDDKANTKELINNKSKTPTFNNDGDKGKDLLGFEKDVKSFASIISYKDIKPPIAIALFGKCGSGKSFFMNKLEEEIKNSSSNNGDESNDSYVKGIAHIKFNAWSYMDSNLWAGLAQSLFEKLNEYITDNTKGDLERLTVELTIAKRLALLNGQFYNYEIKKAELDKLKDVKELEKNNKILGYVSPKYDNILLKFLSDIGIKEEDAKKLLPSQMESTVKMGFRFLNYLKSNQFLIAGSVIGLGLLLLIMKEPISNLLGNISPFLDWLISSWGGVTFSISLPTAITWLFYKGKKILSFNKINAFTTLIADIRLEKESKEEEDIELEKDLIRLDNEIKKISNEISSLELKDHDVNDLAINNFIASKINHEDYKKHQGIISTIRKDFETLSDLFIKRTIDTSNLNEKESERVTDLNKDIEKIDKQFDGDKYQKLERIVLYVDDLDRCSDEKVMQVLEAVNLLMAFPLFVVVVGVDPRWVNNALLKKYQLHFNGNQKKSKIQKIEVSDYLEKIFQIPFHLKKPTDEDAKNMVDHIFKNEIEFTISKKIIQEAINMSDEDVFIAEHQEYLRDQENDALAEYQESLDEQESQKVEIKGIQSLKLTKKEFDYLKSMIWLIDNTPRAIKRFTNIYRIVRSHENLMYDKSDKNRDFLMVMFILGVNIGTYKMCAAKLFKELNKDSNNSLGKILETIDDKDLNSLQIKILRDNSINDLLEIKGSEFLEHISFVRRFSFENIED